MVRSCQVCANPPITSELPGEFYITALIQRGSVRLHRTISQANTKYCSVVMCVNKYYDGWKQLCVQESNNTSLCFSAAEEDRRMTPLKETLSPHLPPRPPRQPLIPLQQKGSVSLRQEP